LYDASPAWSPDGQRIVFERRPRANDPAGASDLYVVSVDDGRIINLTATPSPQFEMAPHWRRTP
jgi:Tol biopolymer transport system component